MNSGPELWHELGCGVVVGPEVWLAIILILLYNWNCDGFIISGEIQESLSIFGITPEEKCSPSQLKMYKKPETPPNFHHQQFQI